MSGAPAVVRDAPAAVPAEALVAASVALPAGVDPLDLLRVLPSARRFYWERRDAGVAIAAVGAVRTVGGDGPHRFAAAADAVARCPAGSVLVGGFGFGAEPPGAPWAAFGTSSWVLPQLAIVRRGRETRLIAAGTVASTLERELADAAAALARPPAAPSPPSRYRAASLQPVGAWRDAVEATLADIAAGRLQKLVLARAARLRADAPFDVPRVLARLRGAYPGCTVFAVGAGTATFLGASPERLAHVDGDGVATAAVAGTAARGATPEADVSLAAALRASPKERAEHAHVVHDVRRRLAPLCLTLDVPDAPGILATETLQHLASPIAGRLRPGLGLFDVVGALHPTPAICGTPRDAALERLPAREGFARGWYGGGIGWADGHGGEVVVAIRTALLDGPRALLHAGAGIVAGSTWERELEETRLKLRPLLGALLEL